MKKLWLLVGLAVFSYYYVTRHVNFASTLAYTKKNKEKAWAPKVDYWIGLAYYQRGEYGKSREAFTQLLTEYPTSYHSSKALLKLSDMAEIQHDWASSRDALTKFLEDYPEHPDRDLAQKRLEIVRNR